MDVCIYIQSHKQTGSNFVRKSEREIGIQLNETKATSRVDVIGVKMGTDNDIQRKSRVMRMKLGGRRGETISLIEELFTQMKTGDTFRMHNKSCPVSTCVSQIEKGIVWRPTVIHQTGETSASFLISYLNSHRVKNQVYFFNRNNFYIYVLQTMKIAQKNRVCGNSDL